MAFRLRPVEHGFFPLFARAGENIKVATHALALMVAAEPGARAGLARRVKDAELAGDGRTREILVKLNYRLTPVDVLRIITFKEVVDTLEDAVDAFETVANTVESIAVKES